MPGTFDIGIVSDEISRDLAEALQIGREWGLSKFEIREGSKNRYPDLTDAEIALLESNIKDGIAITAVSPGIFKAHVDARDTIDRELNRVLPASIDLAHRLECDRVIVFGFERYEGEPQSNRAVALRILEQAGERAEKEDVQIVVENEPNFWFDRMEGVVELLRELDHPHVRSNWDPANAFWGGERFTRSAFDHLSPFIANLHIKDYTPNDPKRPWRPVGDGDLPWRELLGWVQDATDLTHVTIETHCEPLIPSSQQSLEALREILRDVYAG